MATTLDKDLTRLSKVKVDKRDVLITLGEDQTISMKLKGMKSGTVSISIQDLYNQLTGTESEEKPTKESKIKGGKMINLQDLRSQINISAIDYEVKVKLEKFVLELVANNGNR